MICAVATFNIVIITLLFISQINSKCQNGGVNMLVRANSSPHILGFDCLCPFNFYGDSCQNFRQLYCRFANEKVSHYNPSVSSVAELQFEMECFLTKLNGTKKSKGDQNFYQLPLSQTQILNQLKQSNYFMGSDKQIIWANDTSLFDNNGMLIRNQSNLNMTEDEILSQYSPFQFDYTQKNFFGVPIYNTYITYNLSVISFEKASISLGEVQLQFTQIPKGKQTIIRGKLNISINKQWEEYEVARLELLILCQYGEQSQFLTNRIGMNSAKWRVFNPNYKKGSPLVFNNSKIPSSFLVILAFLLLASLIAGGRLAIKYWKRWKSRKQRKLVEEQFQEDRYNA